MQLPVFSAINYQAYYSQWASKWEHRDSTYLYHCAGGQLFFFASE